MFPVTKNEQGSYENSLQIVLRGDIVTKGQLISTSCVAALPAGLALYLMLMAVLYNLSTMPTMLAAASITLLIMAFVILIFPLYLLVFYGRVAPVVTGPPAEKKAQGADKQAAKAKDEPRMMETMVGQSFDEPEVVDLGESSGEFETDAEFEDETFEAVGDEEFEFEEFDYEEDESDKKNKKNKK